MTDVAAWVEDHKKPVAIVGGGAGLLLLLLLLHRRATAQGGTAGPTTQDTSGQYLVPYDSTASGADTGGAIDTTGLALAITGLTTTLANLDPATGATNDGTDGGGGTTIPAPVMTGHPIAAKPAPVHHAKHPTPTHTTTTAPPKKSTAKKKATAPPKKSTPKPTLVHGPGWVTKAVHSAQKKPAPKPPAKKKK